MREAIRGHRRSSERVPRRHQTSSDVIRARASTSSEVIRGHQRSSDVIRARASGLEPRRIEQQHKHLVTHRCDDGLKRSERRLLRTQHQQHTQWRIAHGSATAATKAGRFAIQFCRAADEPRSQRSAALGPAAFGLLERGVYTAFRGMINVGLAHTDDQLAAALDALDDTLRSIAD